MTVVAIWCRHQGDDVIGDGNSILWNVRSGIKRFSDIVAGQTVVCGRITYESFPSRTIEGCKIFVMTANSEYEVSDLKMHKVICTQKELSNFEEDIYIAGGASVYSLFMNGEEKLRPQIIVDCVYEGEFEKFSGSGISISDSIVIMQKKYRRISPFYCLDGVKSAILIRKGEFVEQNILKRIAVILERNAQIQWD